MKSIAYIFFGERETPLSEFLSPLFKFLKIMVVE